MDFEIATRKLKSEQSKLRSNRFSKRKPSLSATAQKQAKDQKKKEEQRRKEASHKRTVKEGMEKYVRHCERLLGVSSLVGGGGGPHAESAVAAALSFPPGKGLQSIKVDPAKVYTQGTTLTATSIWGDGDKITLSPSVLAKLSEKEHGGFGSGSPLTFRVGIVNEDYTFPSSSAMKQKMEDLWNKVTSAEEINEDGESDDDDEEEEDDYTLAYEEELKHRYASYTHATVVEFTQEDGFVGLPSPVASALLSSDCNIPTTRTVDPSSSAAATEEEDDANMVVEMEQDKTPGHLAWGAFDIPRGKIEITQVVLPKGRKCTLVPSKEAAKNGFYGLKDVKLVLEQSLSRTRATLSLNDTVHTWHRGVKFDLQVTSVTPSDYNAISCINTDIEVDIGALETDGKDDETMKTTTNPTTKVVEEKKSRFEGTGQTLMDKSPSSSPSKASPTQSTAITTQQLLSQPIPPEPSATQKENVTTIQIRNERGQTIGRRKFDVSVHTLSHLFVYVSSILGDDTDGGESTFRLVSRFPRHVWILEEDKKDDVLEECGVNAGQMMLFVERE